MSTNIDGLVAPIETTNGTYIDAACPLPEQVPGPYDLGAALGRINRFAGHGRTVCSVAHHSILVACLLQHRGHGREIVLAGLLHDAAECVVGDVPAPVKRIIGTAYRVIEDRVAAAFALAYGLDPALLHAPAVREADVDALAIEAHKMLPSRGKGWGLRRAADVALDADATSVALAAIGCNVDEVRYGPDGDGPTIETYQRAFAAAALHLATTTPDPSLDATAPQCGASLEQGHCVYYCTARVGHAGEHTYPGRTLGAHDGC